jgi:hypothetical protein
VWFEKKHGSNREIQLYNLRAFCNAQFMYLKKFLLLAPALWLTGCVTSTFTRLTPLEQTRNPNNQYHVAVAFNSTQQSMRWDSLKGYVLVNGELYPLRAQQMMSNRWEGFVPVPAGANTVSFRFKFDYLYNSFNGPPKPSSTSSPQYQLKIVDR